MTAGVVVTLVAGGRWTGGLDALLPSPPTPSHTTTPTTAVASALVSHCAIDHDRSGGRAGGFLDQPDERDQLVSSGSRRLRRLSGRFGPRIFFRAPGRECQALPVPDRRDWRARRS